MSDGWTFRINEHVFSYPDNLHSLYCRLSELTICATESGKRCQERRQDPTVSSSARVGSPVSIVVEQLSGRAYLDGFRVADHPDHCRSGPLESPHQSVEPGCGFVEAFE